MSLLADIEASATDPAQSVGDLVRKCQVLAYRLGNELLKTWTSYELGGYPPDAELPRYRAERGAAVRANLSGPFQSFARDVPVPVSLLPEPWRTRAATVRFPEGVGELESMVETARGRDDVNFRAEIPVEVFHDITIYEGYGTMQMWTVVPVTVIAGVLDQVRSRALTFALEIEALDAKAGDVPGATPTISQQSITQIFQTQVLGGTLNWAVAGAGTAQTVASVIPGDFDSLASYLRVAGIEEAELDKLRDAIDADAGGQSREGGLGPRVREWLGGVTARLAASGGRIAEGASGTLIAEALLRFIGGA
jgi:hypothetical protein